MGVIVCGWPVGDLAVSPAPTIATDASRPPAHRAESQPSDAGSRRPDIQGLRAVAVLLVVAFHAGLSVPGGFTGVDVFFVISGFVITAMLLRELDQRSLSFAGFYARRVRRILPASALTISFVAITSIAAISPSAQKTTGTTGIAGSLFTANMLLSRARNGYFDVAPTSATHVRLNIYPDGGVSRLRIYGTVAAD